MLVPHPHRMVVALFIASAVLPAVAEEFSQWAHARDLYTNTSPDGAYVASTVKNFPLLVRLDTGNFAFAEAQGKGQDLRFSDSAGKPLAYQIERWDSTAAKAEVWVKLDSVPGNAMTLSLHMHWGKSDAVDASNGAAVFDSANGFVAAWHLGGADTLGRPNAVPGGLPAKPVRYDGDESRIGIIGMADSLDGAPDGDYLDLGQGYADFNKGFTYSAWVAPSSRAFWSRLLDMGNGAPMDNLVVQRHTTTDDLDFDVYDGKNGVQHLTALASLQPDAWQFVAVTVADRTALIYHNGVLVATDKRTDTIPAVTRLFNYIGKSNWPGNSYYQGKVDETRLCKVARSADWIKLSYANQNAAQNLLAFQPRTGGCVSRFEVPKDTTVAEGSRLELAGVADCAAAYSWTLVSGPGPGILDPEVRTLQIAVPRVTRDVTLRYRFRARYGESNLEKDVAVNIHETLPDPSFTLPANLAWNGKDSLVFKPKLTNLSALRAAGDTLLNWSWTATGLNADTAWRDSALLLKSTNESGPLKIGLCLDNGGTKVCKSATVTVGSVTVLNGVPAAARAPLRPTFDAGGRRLDADHRRHALAIVGFFR